MVSVGYLSVVCSGLADNGAPGLRPNFNKVVYYQWPIEVSCWKSGPENGRTNLEFKISKVFLTKKFAYF